MKKMKIEELQAVYLYLNQHPELKALNPSEIELTQFYIFLTKHPEFQSFPAAGIFQLYRIIHSLSFKLDDLNNKVPSNIPDPWIPLFKQMLSALAQDQEEQEKKDGQVNGISSFQKRKSNGKSLLDDQNAAYVHVLMLGLLTFLFESCFLVISYFLFRR